MATYEIIIKQGGKDGGKGNLAGENDQNQQTSDNIANGNSQLKAVLKFTAVQSARQLVVSKVGETTRNSLLQQKINSVVGLAQTAAAFAVDPVFGAINLAINVASQAIDSQASESQQTSRLSVMAERAGYMNRSRND